MNNYLRRFLQGLLLGLALITAIGGGTMAVLLGVYDDLIIAVSDFRKDPKSALKLLVPMALGGLISVGALFYPIKLLLEHFPFITISFFAGLTLGGLRTFSRTLKGNFKWKHLILSLIGFLFVFSLGAFTWFSTLNADLVNITLPQVIALFFVAFLSMGAHISPGISGTFILVAFGYYEELIDFVLRIIKFDFVNIGYDLSAGFVFVIGSFIGLIAIAKVYKYFLAKNHVKTSYTILGFIVGSITIAYFNGKIKPEYSALNGFNLPTLLISVASLLIGAVIAYLLFGLVNKKEQMALSQGEAKDIIKAEDNDDALGI